MTIIRCNRMSIGHNWANWWRVQVPHSEIAADIAPIGEALAQLQGQLGLVVVVVELLAVAVDPRLIETALGNLIENGLKYTQAGGWVRVHFSIMGKMANLIIADNGIGIAPADLPYVFERFYRVDKARAQGTGGTGLGLAIAAEAAAHLGGHITVTSEPGRGSQFTLSFPI